jgi:hypothetical protein
MDRKTLIELAEGIGLLNDKSVPYSHPAQQRLISRLENLVKKAIEISEKENKDATTN